MVFLLVAISTMAGLPGYPMSAAVGASVVARLIHEEAKGSSAHRLWHDLQPTHLGRVLGAIAEAIAGRIGRNGGPGLDNGSYRAGRR